MRFLILDSDYPWFLNWLYARNPGLEAWSYEDQLRARGESLFACGLSYSSNLRKLGHQAEQIFVNNEALQMAWAREHGLKLSKRWHFRMRRGLVPWLSRIKNPDWLYEILTAQIKQYRPDVLLNNCMQLSPSYFGALKPEVRFLVGSHGSPLPKDRDFGVYDLVLSVVENFVDYFRREGLKSELLRLAFEPAVLERLNGAERSIPVSFVGQLSRHHVSRQSWIEYLSRQIPLHVWAPSTDDLSQGSPVIPCHRGSVWGIEMYKVFRQSDMTLNHHIDVAGSYAGNARLFEATGVGTLLVTDWKKNIHEMFEPGKEVVCYRTPEECVEAIEYYLEHEKERKEIARAGQRRTLREHTYYNRMREFVDIVGRHL